MRGPIANSNEEGSFMVSDDQFTNSNRGSIKGSSKRGTPRRRGSIDGGESIESPQLSPALRIQNKHHS